MHNSALYELAMHEGLGWFNEVIFVSSTQDSYCPIESARV